MKNLNLGAALSISLLLAACASASKTQKQVMTTDPKPFTEPVRPLALPEVSAKPGSCKSISPEVKASGWKRLLSHANVCVKELKWSTLEEYGNELAKRDVASPWGPFYLSLAAEARGDLQRAMWMVELAHKKAPQEGLILYQKSRILLALDQTTAAIQGFTLATKKDPKLFDAHLVLGQIYLRDGEVKDAAVHFQAAISLKPNHVQALIGMVETRAYAGEYAAALEYLGRAIYQQPRNLDYRLREASLNEEGLKNYEVALDIYKKAQRMAGQKNTVGSLPSDIKDRISRLENSVRLAAQAEVVRTPSQQGQKGEGK